MKKVKQVLLAADYGQVEARVIACASKDKKFVDALWNNLDIHMEYAEFIAEIDPDCFERFADGDMKEFRSIIKNKMVFPTFYGSSLKSIARGLGLADHDAAYIEKRFWSDFPGVKRWHAEVWDQYSEFGYVDGLTGRRHRGPSSKNQVINVPIQGAASDITVDAADRLKDLSFDLELPWICPAINVHDDLTFVVPEPEVDEAIDIIVTEMLTFKADWLIVPLQVELEEGPDWYDMSEVGVYNSTEL